MDVAAAEDEDPADAAEPKIDTAQSAALRLAFNLGDEYGSSSHPPPPPPSSEQRRNRVAAMSAPAILEPKT